jgi:hypothetical protein
MEDKYTSAIEYLKKNPNQIVEAWQNPEAHPAGCLFSSVSPSGRLHAFTFDGDTRCGCLTQVRAGLFPAYTPELTRAIRADDSLPDDEDNITIDHLPLFAEWQRKIDAILERGQR